MTTAVSADRLVFLHGFTQTHHHWHRPGRHVAQAVGSALGGSPTMAFVDLPGHGLAADDATPIVDAGPSLAALGGPGTWIGYSMGGRFALHAALERHQIERLVLIGVTPGIADEDERADRRRIDGERADRLEAIGVERFLDEWLAAPLFANLPPDAAGRDLRLANTATGLATSLRTAGTGRQRSLWPELPHLRIPVLVLAGALDTKFTAIGHRMAEALPHGTFVAVDGAGHAAHSERPEAVAAAVATFLATA